jgi:hypothetical protein
MTTAKGIFVGSLHFGGWVDTMEDLICVVGGSVIATRCNSLSPTAREAGKPTIRLSVAKFLAVLTLKFSDREHKGATIISRSTRHIIDTKYIIG